MAKTMSNKKRKGAAQQAKATPKRPKTQAIASPPDSNSDGATFEPKNLQTLILDEELGTTVETLKTLTKYPNLIKSKPCRDLRAAVYDFRQASTTGSISAGMFLLDPDGDITD